MLRLIHECPEPGSSKVLQEYAEYVSRLYHEVFLARNVERKGVAVQCFLPIDAVEVAATRGQYEAWQASRRVFFQLGFDAREQAGPQALYGLVVTRDALAGLRGDVFEARTRPVGEQ